jgi:hypothetical protein
MIVRQGHNGADAHHENHVHIDLMQRTEHGHANALDVRSLKIANGTIIELTNATARPLSAIAKQTILLCAELGTTDPIEGAASKRLKSFNAAQRHPQRIEPRRYIIADPMRDYLRHRTLQRYHRRALRLIVNPL